MAFSRRLTALAAALLIAGGAALWLSPQMRATVLAALKPTDRHVSNHARDSEHGHGAHKHGSGAHGEGSIKLNAEQIAKAKIELAPADKGALTHRIAVTGTITPDSDRVARVAAKVVGTVAELRKRLGDQVTKGEVIAVLESREVADAKSDYLAALVKFDLQKTLFERDQTLWDKRISSEQQFLRSRTALTEAQIRLDVARQKLAALDLSEAEVESLPKQPITALRQKEIRGSAVRADRRTPGQRGGAGGRRRARAGDLRHRRSFVGMGRACRAHIRAAVDQGGAARFDRHQREQLAN